MKMALAKWFCDYFDKVSDLIAFVKIIIEQCTHLGWSKEMSYEE